MPTGDYFSCEGTVNLTQATDIDLEASAITVNALLNEQLRPTGSIESIPTYYIAFKANLNDKIILGEENDLIKYEVLPDPVYDKNQNKLKDTTVTYTVKTWDFVDSVNSSVSANASWGVPDQSQQVEITVDSKGDYTVQLSTVNGVTATVSDKDHLIQVVGYSDSENPQNRKEATIDQTDDEHTDTLTITYNPVSHTVNGTWFNGGSVIEGTPSLSGFLNGDDLDGTASSLEANGTSTLNKIKGYKASKSGNPEHHGNPLKPFEDGDGLIVNPAGQDFNYPVANSGLDTIQAPTNMLDEAFKCAAVVFHDPNL